MNHTVSDPRELSKELLAFLDASPSCFHAVKNLSDLLISAGFTPLAENRRWQVQPGAK